jgi:CubicO group peptidase (beta-lactamase class C family)
MALPFLMKQWRAGEFHGNAGKAIQPGGITHTYTIFLQGMNSCFMKCYVAVLLLSLLFSAQAIGQSEDIVKTEGITSPLHAASIGRITFMPRNIPVTEYSAKDFLGEFELKNPSDFYIRVFLGNSITNYLHQLNPALTLEELNKKGNYRVSFMVDKKIIYQENLNPGAGLPENKNTKTVLTVPLISTANEDIWSRYLWSRFMMNGGEEALSEGIHVFNMEMRPYLNTGEIKVGEIIASGQINILVKKIIIDPMEMMVQPISGGSGWAVSNAYYDTNKIMELNKAILRKQFKEITSIVVIKDGKLLLEEYFNGAGRKTLHDTRSVGKSFSSTMMGIAIDDKHIRNENQVLKEFYDLHTFKNYSAWKDRITLKSLLTMSSGFMGSDSDPDSPGNEENMYPTDNWVKFTLDLPVDSSKTMGNKWDYFTAGVVLIGDIIDKSVPGGLEKYAEEHLFKPLGITTCQWQYTPQKVVNTAGGLQMSSLDYAKYGQLYKNMGKWNDKQVIPETWVKETFTNYFNVPGADMSGYGYLFWRGVYKLNGNDYEAFLCNGNGGNKIIIFTELPLVIVITATAYNKPYAHSQADRIVENFILPAVTR